MLSTIVNTLRPLWTRCNEFALNIETTAFLSPSTRNSNGDRAWWRAEFTDKARHDDGSNYASPDYFYLYKIARILDPSPEDVFYDLGSGKGRMLCLMARRRMRKCVGIELFASHCEAARRNTERLRGRKSPVEIICEDAAKADLSDGTIYFMFNPFGVGTMRDVLDNIGRSLSRNPRRLSIAYHNALHDAVLAERSWLEKYHSFRSLQGAAVSFWKNCPGAGDQFESSVQLTSQPQRGIGVETWAQK